MVSAKVPATMARDELVELLAALRYGASHAQLRDNVPLIHHALDGISRKRSHFLEDACAVVLRLSLPRTSQHQGDSESGKEGDRASILVAVEICSAFAEPLVAKLPTREAGEDLDVTRQRAVLVAFLLYLLGLPELAQYPVDDEACQGASHALAELVLLCGLDLYVLTWTLRFREELDIFRSMLLPNRQTENEGSAFGDGGGVDAEDVDEDNDGEDETWIVHQVASAMGFHGPLEYFLKESGQEYAFASWSRDGVIRLVALRSTVNSTDSSPVVSPFSNLFAVAAVAHALLQSETVELKRQGLTILHRALSACRPGDLEILVGPSVEGPETSFKAASEAFRKRDWISPLVELTSNAMVSFPEQTDRSLGLVIFRQLLQVVESSRRFWLIQRLALRCPYGNIAAILIDQLRNDTFRAWTSATPAQETSPYMSSAIASLIVDLLKLLAERDLKLYADLLASVASLIRFVAIRDKDNRTGLRNEATHAVVKDILLRLQSRLRSTLSQVQPTTASVHDLLHDENARFVLVEAALDSTISLLA